LIVVPRPLPAAPPVVCLSQVLDRGAQAIARGAATQSQREKNNSADVQRVTAEQSKYEHSEQALAHTQEPKDVPGVGLCVYYKSR
jgi:hypothetical protein